jgi:hypothetical protein
MAYSEPGRRTWPGSSFSFSLGVRRLPNRKNAWATQRRLGEAGGAASVYSYASTSRTVSRVAFAGTVAGKR